MIVKPKKVYKSFERTPVYDLSFENVHNFLLEDGVVVHNCDTFQSYDLLQQLSAHNFNTQIISVDKVTDKICKPYQYFKSAIYENRIQMYENKLLTEEIIGLEKNNNSGKVDHTPNGINSKDQADAVCGALWNASNHAEEFDFEFGDRIDTMIDVSSEVSPEMQQKQLTIDFENELKKVQSDFSNSMSLPNVGEDYYFANDIIII